MFLLIIYRPLRGDKPVDLIDPVHLPQNWWTKSEGQHLDTGSSYAFDYTIPLKERRAEMFKLSGNQTAARRETQTRDERRLPTNKDGGKRVSMGFLNKCQASEQTLHELVSLSAFLASTQWSELQNKVTVKKKKYLLILSIYLIIYEASKEITAISYDQM